MSFTYIICSPCSLLHQVTGIRGLMARSVVDENVTVDGEEWHESSSEQGWLWKGDTSSDEVVGHMFAFPLVYDLVAEDDEAMKDEVETLVDDIIGKSYAVYVVYIVHVLYTIEFITNIGIIII